MIRYVIGSAVEPQVKQGDTAIIAHICNNRGVWGAGFVLAVSEKWPSAERHYREFFESGNMALGDTMLCNVQPGIFVANMIAQDGFPSQKRRCAVDFDALELCLDSVVGHSSVHMPRIGCGIAGATWDQIEPIIQRTLCANGVSVTVYDLPKRGNQ